MKRGNLYDIIILDTPPIGMVTDALLLSRISDLSLFLLRQNYSSKNILELFEDIYIKNEMGKMGIILNDMKQRGYYGYGYRYYNSGYTYKYGYYSAYNEYTEGKGIVFEWSVVSGQLISFQLSVVRCQLSAVSFQLSVFSYQPSVDQY